MHILQDIHGATVQTISSGLGLHTPSLPHTDDRSPIGNRPSSHLKWITVPTGDAFATLPTKLPLAGVEGTPQMTGGAI